MSEVWPNVVATLYKLEQINKSGGDKAFCENVVERLKFYFKMPNFDVSDPMARLVVLKTTSNF